MSCLRMPFLRMFRHRHGAGLPASVVLASAVLACALLASMPATVRAQSAIDQLQTLDKTLSSGALELHVDRHAPPGRKGVYDKPERNAAHLLFERPDRFRFTLRPGAKNELVIVAEAGIVRWRDAATGITGKAAADEVTDPLALVLLDTAGELSRLVIGEELVLSKNAGLRGVRLQPGVGGSGVESALAWFGDDGQPVGLAFAMRDGARVFISVLRLRPNVQTRPEDFRL